MNLPPRRPVVASALGAAVALLVAAVGTGGCSSRPPEYKGETADKEATSPWPTAVAQLRKESDAAACKRILSQLNSDLANNPDAALRPDGLTRAGEEAARKLLRLTDGELNQVRGSAYTALDAHYLAESLYLRDAARSLGAAGLPPGRQAELAFDWVCRQLVLGPWVSPVNTEQGQRLVANPPVPVTAALRKGSASGLERAYVFLALLQQLGLDGCLVGPPEAADRGWSFDATPNALQPPKGPFWAVGCRADGDVLLFEPWRGEPFPNPGGGVAALARVKADEGLLKAWREDKARPWAVPADAVKAGVPFLAVPLSAVAPRLARLEQELKADAPVRLAVDPAGLQDRFAGKTGAAATFWNPTGEPFTLTRVLGSFTPADDGGTAQSPELIAQYQISLLPHSLFSVPEELLPRDDLDAGVPEAQQRLRFASFNRFGEAFFTTPPPREQIHRGQFADVTRALVLKRQGFTAAAERVRTDGDRKAKVRDWAAKARDVYTALTRARRDERENPGAVAAAGQAVEEFWRREAATVSALIDAAVADAGSAESTFLLAQCMHEQAEQAEARSARAAADPKQAAGAGREKARAGTAWAEAKEWWRLYDAYAAAQDRTFPGRAAHARRLADRANRLAAEAGPGR